MAAGVAVLAAMAAAPASGKAAETPAAPPGHVSVYSSGRTVRAVTGGYCRISAPPQRCVAFSYLFTESLLLLPVRAGGTVVVRTWLPARSVSVGLRSASGRPLAEGRARALSPARTVWRHTLGPAAGGARLMRLSLDYRPGFSGTRPGSPVTYYWPACGVGAVCSQAQARSLLVRALAGG